MAQGSPNLPHHRRSRPAGSFRKDYVRLERDGLAGQMLAALFPLGLIALLGFALVLPELLAWLFGGACQ